MLTLASALALVLSARTVVIHAVPATAQDAAAATPATTEEHSSVDAAREHFAQAKQSAKRKESEGARRAAAQAIDLLVALSASDMTPAGEQLLFDIGTFADQLGQLELAQAAHERVLFLRSSRLSADHPDVLKALITLASTLQAKGDLDVARAMQERAIDAYERRGPDDDLELTAARGRLAVTLGMLGDLAEARSLQERVLSVYGRSLQADDSRLIVARGNLAVTLQVMGDLPGSMAILEQVLAELERTLPEDHLDLAFGRLNLGVVMLKLGDLRGARVLFERALDVFERKLPADHPNLAVAVNNLASTLTDPDESLALCRRVVAMCERSLPDEHPHRIVSRMNLGWFLLQTGDVNGARALFESVVQVFERTMPDDHPYLCNARMKLALTLGLLGDLAGARAILDRVLAVLSESMPADHPDLLEAAGNLAVTLANAGDLESARGLQERLLSSVERSFPADHHEVTAHRLNLAQTRSALGDLDGALELQKLVLQTLEHNVSPDHPDRLSALGGLSQTLFERGEISDARAIQEQLVQDLERLRPDGDSDLTSTRWVLANIRASEAPLVGSTVDGLGGSDDEARRSFAKLALDYVRGLRILTRATLLDGSYREVEERLASRQSELGHALSLASGLGVFPADMVAIAETFLLCETSRAGGLTAARLALPSSGDLVVIDLRGRLSGATEELTRRAQSGASAKELEQASAAVDQLERDLVRRAGQLLETTAPIDPTLELLADRLAPGEALVGWHRLRLSDVPSTDGNSRRGTDSMIAFVLRPRPAATTPANSPIPSLTYFDLGSVAPIEHAVGAWLRGVGSASEARGLGETGRTDRLAADALAGVRLRGLLLDPLRGSLSGAARVIVALDDVLHAFPLDALPAGEEWGGGRASSAEGEVLLGDVLRLDVHPSLLDALFPTHGYRGEPALLAIGGAEFDEDPAKPENHTQEVAADTVSSPRSEARSGVLRGGTWARGFPALPGARAEAQGVADLFTPSSREGALKTVLEGSNASREALVASAPKARWLHVATHGWFAPDSVRSSADPLPPSVNSFAVLRMDATERLRGMTPMLLCGLALAGANLPVDSFGRIPGLVTAQEIASLDLSNCELAVLSACDTSVGVRRAGQGVASLQRALHMAGARSVITSLWKVPDEATKDLMLDFYRRLWVEKKPKHRALWEAKTKLRNARDERGNHRYSMRDWGAWVLTGDPD